MLKSFLSLVVGALADGKLTADEVVEMILFFFATKE